MASRRSTYEFDAIGSRFWLERLDGGLFSAEIRNVIDAYVALFDRRYSRFRDDSLVAELFETGRIAQPPEEMLRMLDFAKDMYVVTEGVFDLTVAGALSDLGYGPHKHSAVPRTDLWDVLSYFSEEITCPTGVMLDFGGFGKGWLIDEIAQIMRDHGATQFIVNGGGDLFVQSDTPVEFALEDPFEPDTVYKTVSLTTGALAGSNVLKRAWSTEKGPKHHIIDPRTGDSSQSQVVASYVITHRALIADTLATIVIIRPELKDTLARAYDAHIILI
jgi:thiamine biosynthesis lipoprotein